MAQRVLVLLEDDLDHSEATQTVRFGLDGVDHEIDLNDQHANQLREAFATWVAAARKVATTRAARPARASTMSTGPGHVAPIDPEQSRQMRAWGREHGRTLSDKGRIPQTVQDAYHQTH